MDSGLGIASPYTDPRMRASAGSIELWAVHPTGAELLSKLPAPAGGRPFRVNEQQE